MPSALVYVMPSDNSKQSRDLNKAGEDELSKNAVKYDLAWAQYNGNHHKPLKLVDNVDNNVIINVTAQAIDRMAAFLFPKFPKIDIEPITSDVQTVSNDETEENEYSEKQWELNDDALFLGNLTYVSALGGHAFVRIVPSNNLYDYNRLVIYGVDQVVCYWSAEDKQTPIWYRFYFQIGKQKYINDYVHETIMGGNGWTIYGYVKEGQSWNLVGSTPWPYEYAPIIDSPHLPDPRSYYGKQDVCGTSLNDSINKVASDIKAILRNHAAPKIVATGLESDVVPSSIDGLWTTPDNDVDFKNIEMQSDLKSSMDYLLFLIQSFYDEVKVAKIEGGPDAFKGLTNLAIKAAFMDMVAKNEILRRMYGKTIKKITETFLALNEYDVTKYSVNIIWPNALPMSDIEEAQTIQLKRDMGLISKETASDELGYDFEQEQERIANEGDPAAEALQKIMDTTPRQMDVGNNQQSMMNNTMQMRNA